MNDRDDDVMEMLPSGLQREDEIGLLRHIIPTMVQCMDIPTLRLYLFSGFAINERQNRQIQAMDVTLKEEAVMMIIQFLQQNFHQPARKLLEVLQRMQSNGSGSEAVQDLIGTVEDSLMPPPPLAVNSSSASPMSSRVNSAQSILSLSGYDSSLSNKRRSGIRRRRMRHSRSSTPVSCRVHSQRRMQHSPETTYPSQWIPPIIFPPLPPLADRPPSRKKSNDITSAYATFGVQVARVLEKKTSGSPNYVHMWLALKFSPSDPAGRDMYNNLALYDDSQSLSQLLIKLNQYTSWFDYDHLASLARELGGEEGKKLVEEYEEKLSVHLRKNISQMPKAHEDAPEGFEEVEMKLDWDWDDTNGEVIVRFRETISRLLHRPSSSILFKEAREGCVLLTLLVSCKLAPVVKHFAESNQLLLALHDILSIKVAGTLIPITDMFDTNSIETNGSSAFQSQKTQASTTPAPDSLPSATATPDASNQLHSPFPLLESSEQNKASTRLYSHLSSAASSNPDVHHQINIWQGPPGTEAPVNSCVGSTRNIHDTIDSRTISSKDSGYNSLSQSRSYKNFSTDSLNPVHRHNLASHPETTLSRYKHRHPIKFGKQQDGRATVFTPVQPTRSVKLKILSPPPSSSRRKCPFQFTLKNASRKKFKILVPPKKSNQLQQFHLTRGLLLNSTGHVSCTQLGSTKHHTVTNLKMGFSMLVLTRASGEIPANLKMTAIRGHQASRPGEVGVEQGEHLTALYQRKGATYVVTKNGKCGFIPSNVCFLSSMYQKDASKVTIFNNKHTFTIPLEDYHKEVMHDAATEDYPISTFNPSLTYQPIQAISVQQHRAKNPTELSVQRGEFISVLFYDDQWVYGITEGRQAGFVPSFYCHFNFF